MNKKEYMKMWRQQNQDRIREYQRLYRRRFYLRDKEKIIQSLKKWRSENKSKVREYLQKYKLNHPEKVAQWKRNRSELLKIKRLEERQNAPINLRLSIERELDETNRRLEKYKNKNLTFEELMNIILKKK